MTGVWFAVVCSLLEGSQVQNTYIRGNNKKDLGTLKIKSVLMEAIDFGKC